VDARNEGGMEHTTTTTIQQQWVTYHHPKSRSNMLLKIVVVLRCVVIHTLSTIWLYKKTRYLRSKRAKKRVTH
jgi:hypothetical protein